MNQGLLVLAKMFDNQIKKQIEHHTLFSNEKERDREYKNLKVSYGYFMYQGTFGKEGVGRWLNPT